jgi:hypothetical protein
MTGNTRHDPTDADVAGEAALIATFYGPSDGQSIHDLHEQFYRRLSSPPRKPDVPPRWENREDLEREAFGHRFKPPGRAAIDTTVVQLALNAPGDAANAWKDRRQKLEEEVEALDTSALEGIWGYTLVYQARLKDGVTRDHAMGKLMPSITRLCGKEQLHPLAKTDVPDDGRVWLLGTADHVDGLSAGTVYCALGPPKAEEALLDMFYGDRAVLLIPDLIAHKGYYQMRQYLGRELGRRYKENMRYLREITEDLLEDLELQREMGAKLEDLFTMYIRLVPAISALKELHVSMRQQFENYNRWREHYKRWRAHVEGNGVVEFHGDQVRTAVLELQLMIEPLQYALDTADKAVSAAQAQVEIKQESNQRRFEAWLAVGALSLATAELVDWQATKALFGGNHSNLELFLAQVFIVGVIFVVLWLLLVRRRP